MFHPFRDNHAYQLGQAAARSGLAHSLSDAGQDADSACSNAYDADTFGNSNTLDRGDYMSGCFSVLK